MELNATKREVDQSGFINAAHHFTIKESPLAFKILSDSLYSDKPLAVIRELSCNAYDAHAMAENEAKPFDVHLPNQFEPFFSIRDYGTGMSNEDVLGLFTTFFHSTKTTTNKAIGCLGLGSKSPFSYVDQFTITAWFDGQKSEFQAWIDQEGQPLISLLNSKKSNEPNGIQIHMMVNASDMKAFAERARRFYHRFPVTPNITGNKDAILTNVKYVLEGPNYKLRGNDDIVPYGEHKGAYAIQGVVAYPINAANITEELTYNQRELLTSMAIDIIFPIGELQVAPSREQLSYSKVTQQNIVKALKEIEKHVPKHAKDTLANAKNEFEARLLYHRWLKEGSTESKFMRKVLGNKLKWGGMEIDTHYMKLHMFNKIDFDKAKAAKKDAYVSDETFLEFLADNKVESYGSITRYQDWNVKNAAHGRKLNGSYFKELDVDPATLISDIKDFKDDGNQQVMIIWADTPEIRKNTTRFIEHNFAGKKLELVVIKLNDDKFMQDVKDQFKGWDGFVSASTLDVPPVLVKDPKTKSDVRKLFQVTGVSDTHWNNNLALTDSKYDVVNGGTYVVMFNNGVCSPKDQWLPTGSNPSTNSSEILKIFSDAKNLGLIDFEKDNIYAFNSTHKNIIKDNPGWISLFDLIKNRVNAKLADKEWADNIANMTYFKELRDSTDLHRSMIGANKAWENVISKVVSKNSKILKYFNDFTASALKLDAFIKAEKIHNKHYMNEDMTDTYHNSYDLTQLSEFVNRVTTLLGAKKLDLTKIKAKAEKEAAQLDALYPELETILDSYNIKKQANGVALYINMCDKSRTLIKSTDFTK